LRGLSPSIKAWEILPAHHIPEYHIKWIENPSEAPNGAKGLGEAPTIGTPVALVRSIELNTGRRIRETPIKFNNSILLD
jgi:carbon-monoxide dehydrogenase large subunit